MAQFDVYRNTRNAAYPYLLDFQSQLHSSMDTLLIVPLIRYKPERVMKRLTPVLAIQDEKYIAMIPMMAGTQKSMLGHKVASVAKHRDELIAALDFLVTGS